MMNALTYAGVFFVMDAAARANLSYDDLSRYEIYKAQMLSDGHPPANLRDSLNRWISDKSAGSGSRVTPFAKRRL